MNSDKRRSGIPFVSDLPWGTRFCQFYQTWEELTKIIVPYLKAGLENNELCIWVTSRDVGDSEATRAMKEAVPGLEQHLAGGRLEIISQRRWSSGGAGLEEAIAGRLARAATIGLDGLRLACTGLPRKQARNSVAARIQSTATGGRNVIAMFAYPRDRFDAIGLMDVVKDYRFALVRDAAGWEVIESSEARATRDALRESERLYSSLFENMLDGYAYCRMIYDNGRPKDFVYLSVNRSFERLTGLKNVVGRRVSEVIPGLAESNPEVLEIYGKVALTGKPERFETHIEPLGIWLSISVYSPRKGTFVAVFDNVTDRKLAEDALRHRTSELEAANNELEAFSYSVSHDLRAPLRTMSGFSHALLEDCGERLDANGKEYLERIRHSAKLMGHLIDDLLTLSRVTRGDMRREEADLTRLAQDVAMALREANPSHNVRFTVTPGMSANGDRRLLLIVLENLLGNAWKFTGKVPEAKVEFAVADTKGQKTYLVRDNGAGFDMAYSHKLFLPFQRLHNEEEFPGTGIGLATVQRIIRRHGGEVWAEGAVGQGATFYFTLG